MNPKRKNQYNQRDNQKEHTHDKHEKAARFTNEQE